MPFYGITVWADSGSGGGLYYGSRVQCMEAAKLAWPGGPDKVLRMDVRLAEASDLAIIASRLIRRLHKPNGRWGCMLDATLRYGEMCKRRERCQQIREEIRAGTFVPPAIDPTADAQVQARQRRRAAWEESIVRRYLGPESG